MHKAKMKIKPNANRQQEDAHSLVKRKLLALMLMKQLHSESKPKRDGALAGK